MVPRRLSSHEFHRKHSTFRPAAPGGRECGVCWFRLPLPVPPPWQRLRVGAQQGQNHSRAVVVIPQTEPGGKGARRGVFQSERQKKTAPSSAHSTIDLTQVSDFASSSSASFLRTRSLMAAEELIVE